MEEAYILDWLDTLVTVTLNPEKADTATVFPGDIDKIKNQVISQKNKVQHAIKSTVFNLNDEAKIKCLIKKYHISLISLLDQALEDQAAMSNSSLKDVMETIVSCIDELLFMIERRFGGFLSIEAPVPATYLVIKKEEVIKKLSYLSKEIQDHEPLSPTFEILKQALEVLLDRSSGRYSCTFRELFYVRYLCEGLERLKLENGQGIYTALDELLIGMNFNSSEYIKDLIHRISVQTDGIEQTGEKKERLLFYQKLFRQIHRKPGIIFNAKNTGVFLQVDNWLSQEILYLEKHSYYSGIKQKHEKQNRVSKNNEKQKIVSNLSVDQMALILRAADDLRIIVARSLNNVFKSIVPYLSTSAQKNLSYDSMRSKSYAAESRDKAIVIETLQQMINRIKEY